MKDLREIETDVPTIGDLINFQKLRQITEIVKHISQVQPLYKIQSPNELQNYLEYPIQPHTFFPLLYFRQKKIV